MTETSSLLPIFVVKFVSNNFWNADETFLAISVLINLNESHVQIVKEIDIVLNHSELFKWLSSGEIIFFQLL